MGYKIKDEKLVSDADSDDHPPAPIIVSGTSTSMSVIVRQNNQCVSFDESLLSKFIELIRSKSDFDHLF